MNTTAATATAVQTALAATTGTRVITNISAFNPAAPMVDVMVLNTNGCLIHSKSYAADLGAEAITAQAAAEVAAK